MILVERQVCRVSELASRPHQLGVQPLGVGVALLGALPVLPILLPQLLDIRPRERLGFRILLARGFLGG
jgi:hypothetical protein